MFCDLVGSTALAARLDAEDWRNLVNAYLDEATSAVTALGGHVLKRLGDGLMALFGYPQAQENDAERAVRAALAIQRALAELNARNAGRNAPELSAEIRRFDKVNAYLYGWGLAARKGPRSKGRPEGRPSSGGLWSALAAATAHLTGVVCNEAEFTIRQARARRSRVPGSRCCARRWLLARDTRASPRGGPSWRFVPGSKRRIRRKD